MNFEEKYKPPLLDDELADEEKTWAMLSHLSYLLTFVIGVSMIAPLVIWLVKKDSSEFVEDQAKEALNFQISVLIASIVVLATCVGALLLPVIIVLAIVYSVQAGMAANQGERHRYPYTFRLIH